MTWHLSASPVMHEQGVGITMAEFERRTQLMIWPDTSVSRVRRHDRAGMGVEIAEQEIARIHHH